VFFDLCEEQAGLLMKAAERLHQGLQAYELPNAASLRDDIHTIEHAGDELVQTALARLNRTFVTPIDREDLYALTRALDDVLDEIDAAAEHFGLMRIETATAYACELARLIVRSAEEIAGGVRQLRRLRDAESLLHHCVRIEQLESQGDQVLHQALAELFGKAGADPIEVLKWKNIYENLETATDTCQAVAGILRTVAIKHA
jgi:predicted phosphate transport protein (TIGR00153 family)